MLRKIIKWLKDSPTTDWFPESNKAEKVQRDNVSYTINNAGGLEIDVVELVSSKGWQRQVSAAKRMKRNG